MRIFWLHAVKIDGGSACVGRNSIRDGITQKLFWTNALSWISFLVLFYDNIVATSPVVLRWLCDSPRTGCAWRITPLCMWREQAIMEWSRRVISIVACCHGAKLCAHAARDFRSQQYEALVFFPNAFGRLARLHIFSHLRWIKTRNTVWQE